MKQGCLIRAFVYGVVGLLFYVSIACPVNSQKLFDAIEQLKNYQYGNKVDRNKVKKICQEVTKYITADSSLLSKNENEKKEMPLTQLIRIIKYISYRFPYYIDSSRRVGKGCGTDQGLVEASLDAGGEELIKLLSFMLEKKAALKGLLEAITLSNGVTLSPLTCLLSSNISSVGNDRDRTLFEDWYCLKNEQRSSLTQDASYFPSSLEYAAALKLLKSPVLGNLKEACVCQGPTSFRLLHWAIRYIHDKGFIKTLIHKGCSIENVDQTTGQTPLLAELQRAKENDVKPDLEIIELLTSGNAELLESKDHFSGMTALQIALIYGYDDVIKELLACGAGIMTLTTGGENILHLAMKITFAELGPKPKEGMSSDAQEIAEQAVLQRVMRIISEKKLTPDRKKILICQKDKFGRTPLHHFKGKEEDLEKLLEYQPDLSIQTETGDTIFHQLARRPALIVNKKFIEYVKASVSAEKLSDLINSRSGGMQGFKSYSVLHIFMEQESPPTREQLTLFFGNV